LVVWLNPLAISQLRENRIWEFAHVLSGARLGSDCNVCACVFIEGGVIVGDRVTIKNGVQL